MDEGAVTRYLDGQGIGAGPVTYRRIGEGHSNITYLVRRGGTAVVLRRGPRPPVPKSTHDMVREATIQQALAGTGVPVPRILAVCADESVLGVPFYVMEYIEGHVVTTGLPDGLDPRRVSEQVVDTLVALHGVDVAPFAGLGRPDGYLRRQVTRFTGLWDISATRPLPEVKEISDWLGAHVPESRRLSVVHGDYRLGNMMFAGGAVAAVLDWEMATLGDPLADLGYLTATWSEAGQPNTPIELSPVTSGPGFYGRSALVDRYADATGTDPTALPWYQALALWKSAIFCEAIYRRWLDGEHPDDTTFAPNLEAGVPHLLKAAAAVLHPVVK